MAVQRRRSQTGALVAVVGVALLLTPVPPQVAVALVVLACVLVVGGGPAHV